jgi:hypothetical protein
VSRRQGFAFEEEFVSLAVSRGYGAYRVPGLHTYDAFVAGKRVQCKDKQFDEDGRVRIARGQHRYHHGAWDILALRWRGELYLIPEGLLRSAASTLLTVIRPDNFRNWIDAWAVFGEPGQGERMVIEKQTVMFQ